MNRGIGAPSSSSARARTSPPTCPNGAGTPRSGSWKDPPCLSGLQSRNPVAVRGRDWVPEKCHSRDMFCTESDDLPDGERPRCEHRACGFPGLSRAHSLRVLGAPRLLNTGHENGADKSPRRSVPPAIGLGLDSTHRNRGRTRRCASRVSIPKPAQRARRSVVFG